MSLLEPQVFLSPGSIAAAIETTVANIDSPTELNSLGTSQGELRLARTTQAGDSNETLYYLDTTSSAQDLPYIVTSLTAGLKWLAVSGYAQAQALKLKVISTSTPVSVIGNINAYSEINSQNLNASSSASSDLVATADNGTASTHYVDFGINGSTGGVAPFTAANAGYVYTTDNQLNVGAIGATGAINMAVGTTPTTVAIFDITSGVTFNDKTTTTKQMGFDLAAATASTKFTFTLGAQTASRSGTLPVLTGNSIFAMSNATFTTARVPFATTNGILTDSASLTYNGTTLGVPQLTNAGLTSGRVTFAGASGILSDSANFTFSTTVLNIANTTAAAAATSGSLTVGNGTAATNVGIGGGVVWSGSKLIAGATASAPSSLFVKNQSGDNFVSGICMQRNSTLDTWSFLVGGDNNYYFGYANNASGADATGDFTNMARFNTSAGLSVYGTTSASSSITGALVIGDGATAATNVGIGGGKIYTGGTATFGGNVRTDTGSASAQNWILCDDAASAELALYNRSAAGFSIARPAGTSDLSFYGTNCGFICTFKNLSAATGKASLFYTTAASSSITGGFVVGDGATAATNVGIGGGAIYAGGIISTPTAFEVSGTSGSFAAGRIYAGATNGLTIGSKAGSSFDFILTNPSGSLIISVPTGTMNVVLAGSLSIASATMLTTTVSLTNGAAAAAGTLLNAPVAGNPTKWAPVNDNGTTRYIPMW